MPSLKRSMIAILLPVAVLIARCADNATGSNDKPNAGEPYIVKETVARGDTGMTKLTGIKRVNELSILCQRWEVGANEGATSPELLPDEDNSKIKPGFSFYTDSQFVANPRGRMATGTWRITEENGARHLLLTYADKQERTWLINELNSGSLRLVGTGEKGNTLYLNLSSDGLVHKNHANDPFHPLNNQWRIKPAQPENDSALVARTKQCVQFFALFYRDNILRKKDKINFAGFPVIFTWYSRGIGLPDWNEISDSWVNCFYDRKQARKGYDILRKLIVNHEFNWVKGLPDWRMETEHVLEQMYHKL